MEKGFHLACTDIAPSRARVIYPEKVPFPMTTAIEAMGLDDAIAELKAKG